MANESEAVVTATKKHFARLEIPDVVLSDNGPQFRAKEYEQFAESWEFSHITSSPYHSQGNGKAESAVKIAKRLIKKAKEGPDLQLAILNWRNTPTEGSMYSPVQKLQSRRTKTLLPTQCMLQPERITGVTEEIIERRKKAKLYYDRGAKLLPELEIGQTVRMQPAVRGTVWGKAVNLKQVGNRSYLVQTNKGNVYCRNRRFLKTARERNSEDPTVHTPQLEVPESPPPMVCIQEQGQEEEQPPEVPSVPVCVTPARTSASGRTLAAPSRYKDLCNEMHG